MIIEIGENLAGIIMVFVIFYGFYRLCKLIATGG